MDASDRIVQAADALFNTRGYRSVTMADLASELGMSKKTLYLSFSSKAEIAETIVEGMFARINQAIEAADLEAQPTKNLVRLVHRIKTEVGHMQPIFLRDIQKSMPDLWDRIEEFRAARILGIAQRAIRLAQDKGEIRPMDAELTAMIFLETVQAVIRPDFLSRHDYSTAAVMDTMLNIFFYGILSKPISSET